MPAFFSVRDNTFHTRGSPWVASLIEGLGVPGYCKREGRTLQSAAGDMVARLEPDKGTKWSDVLGCGAYPLLIVSERVIDLWATENVGTFPIHEVRFAAQLPKRLRAAPPPRYFWVDGEQLRGALVDFEASGFVGVKFCPECGTRSDDIVGTFAHQTAKGARFSYVFRDNTWNGLNLFTTDISPGAFFCTERVLDCARKHKLTNFHFVPIEEGDGDFGRELKYM